MFNRRAKESNAICDYNLKLLGNGSEFEQHELFGGLLHSNPDNCLLKIDFNLQAYLYDIYTQIG